MKITAYGFNLRKQDYELIHKMIRFVTTDVADIFDLKSYDAEIHPEDTLFLYGHKAVAACADKECETKIEFPDATRLDPALHDTEAREEAWGKLTKLKEVLDSGTIADLDIKEELKKITITTELLPDLTSNQVQMLENILKKKGNTEWLGTTKDGHTIRLAVEPGNSTADIDLTFAELFTLRTAMEKLQVKELEFVYKPSSVSRKDHS